MYEQSLDQEYFHPEFAMHQAESRFYDDYNHMQPMYMKNSPGPPPLTTPSSYHDLPTPPSTPDKAPVSFNGSFNHSAAHYLTQTTQFPPPAVQAPAPSAQHRHHPFSPTGGILQFFLYHLYKKCLSFLVIDSKKKIKFSLIFSFCFFFYKFLDIQVVPDFFGMDGKEKENLSQESKFLFFTILKSQFTPWWLYFPLGWGRAWIWYSNL